MIDQAQPDAELVRAVWAGLLACADAAGVVRADPRALASAAPLAVNEKQVEAVIRRCRAEGLLEGRNDAGPWRLRTRAVPPPLDWGEVAGGRLYGWFPVELELDIRTDGAGLTAVQALATDQRAALEVPGYHASGGERITLELASRGQPGRSAALNRSKR